MLTDFLLIIAGLFLLYLGAGSIVTSSSRIARRMGLSELWIGLTVVAFGTSLPELVVGLHSNITGVQDITLSNIAGANINNITLILGISGLIAPLTIRDKSTRREVSFLILATVVFFVLAVLGHDITRLDGIILFALFGYFTFSCCFVDFFREPPICRKCSLDRYHKIDLPEIDEEELKKKKPWWDIALIVFGIVALTFGGRVSVDSAVSIATALEIPQKVVGATIVALGTTLPELFTSVFAASRGELDISIGNIIGSCIFNILTIVGIASIIKPIGVNPTLLTFDFPFMILMSVIIIPMISPDFHIDKTESIILLLCYVFYVLTNLLR
ncbi:MAG: calcium/sodium antiporter [Candidatus Zixiibacteriota bacterium]